MVRWPGGFTCYIKFILKIKRLKLEVILNIIRGNT